ncbi:MAG: putative transport system permease protein [Gaiellales bacterium]|nr:putative transport system permease protein [Gaiellales bacterium]
MSILSPTRPTPAMAPDESPTLPIEPDAFALLAAELPHGRGGRLAVSLPSAVEALRANKGRAVLTTLGIIIGVAAVIVMVALGQGASAQVSARFQGLGTNVLTISPGSSQSGGVRGGAGTVTSLTEADAKAIAEEVPGVAALSPVVSGNAQVIIGNQNWQTRIQGVAPEYQQIQNWQVAQGGFFSDEENAAARSVAVLGQTVVKNLFPSGQDPVGQLIRVRNVPFSVVGVLAAKGSNGFQDQDDVVLIPFETGQIRLFGASALNSISVQVTAADQMTPVTQRLTQFLRQRHRLQTGQGDDFTVRNSADIVNTAQGVAQTLTMLLGGVAAVSLIVGGIGIMNIMLVSVTERTREIGIRMAIGARPGHVLTQFLVEAVLLSVLGGLIGVAIGVGAAIGVPQLAGWPTAISYEAIGIAFGFAALVGVFFGYYPARKASQLNPIDALRSD